MSNREAPTTSICRSNSEAIFIREASLVDDLIGKISFTEMIYFHITGRKPTGHQAAVLDAVLVTLMEHGLTPSTIASRMVYHSAPECIQAAAAAGVMCAGSTFLGTMEGCAKLLKEMLDSDNSLEQSAQVIVERFKREKRTIPGLGHPFHKPDDPRAPRLIAVAEGGGVPGRHITALRVLAQTADHAYGKHLTINATGATAALLGEIDIPQEIGRGVAVIARAAGVVGHIYEEMRKPAARHIWAGAEEAVPYAAE